MNNLHDDAPTELNEVNKIVREFIERLTNVDNEIAGLKESRKDLLDEYKGQLDLKTLTTAMKVMKMEANVNNRGTYDEYQEILGGDFANRVTD